MTECLCDVRFTAKSGHSSDGLQCLLCANSGRGHHRSGLPNPI